MPTIRAVLPFPEAHFPGLVNRQQAAMKTGSPNLDQAPRRSPEPSPSPGDSAPSRMAFGLLGWSWSRLLILFFVVFFLGMGVVSLFGNQGWLAYRRLETEAVTLRGEVSRLETQQQKLIRELDALRNDPAYIELLARQRLGLVKPGERVVQLPVPEADPNTGSAEMRGEGQP